MARLRSFVAVDAAGKKYTIVVTWTVAAAGTRADPDAEVVTGFALKTKEGLHVNSLGGHRYEILTNGLDGDIEVTTDNPEAPT